MHRYRYLSKLLPSQNKREIVLLTGARQTGKTTMAQSVFPSLRYINLDAPENREFIRAVSSSSWGRDVGSAVIDEAQKEPVVFEKIKYAYDEKAISFSLILGSSQILLLKKIRESLAGRVSIYELWPLLMSEVVVDATASNVPDPLIGRLLSGDGHDIGKVLSALPSRLIDSDDGPYRDAEAYLLKWGGMPALLPLQDPERMKWLKDYEYTYLERDLGDLSRLDDLEPFRKFQKLAALRSGNLLSYSELARDAGVSVDTARRYLEYLRLSYQVILLQPYYKNITSSVVKTPKIYWLDTGILRSLSGFWSDPTGSMYETMVVSELIKWVKTVRSGAEVYFYRTRGGLEVDAIIELNGGIIGIEAKMRKTVSPVDIRPLKDIALKLGAAWRGGMVVYLGDEIRKVAEPNIWAMPSRRLFGAGLNE